MLNSAVHRVPKLQLRANARTFSHVPFRVYRGAVVAPSDPIHANQRVECTWTIRSDASDAPASPRSHHRRRWAAALARPARIEKLQVLTPGLTIVRVRPELHTELGEDTVARVRVSSSSADVLRSVRIASQWPNRAMLGFHAPPAVDQALTGHLLTEIDLPHVRAVRSVAAVGLGDVVVLHDVLYCGGDGGHDRSWEHRREGRHRHRARCGRRSADRQSLKLFAANESRLFVDDSAANMQLAGLKIGAMGTTSRVAIDCASLDLGRALDVGVIGGHKGGVALSTDSLIASRLKLMAIGNGELELTIRGLLEADEVKTFAVGNTLVHVETPDGTRDDDGVPRRASVLYQSTATIGKACVDTSSLATQRAKVTTIGSNDLHLHARDALRVRSVGSNVIECVDRLPRQLDVRGLPHPTLVETPNSEVTATAEAKHGRDGIQYPSAQDAFEREALLSSPRSSFLSRWFGGTRHHGWGSNASADTASTSSSSDGSSHSSSSHRGRRRGRWAEDSWM